MNPRLASRLAAPRGNSAAAPAYLPPYVPNPQAASNGLVSAGQIAALRSVYLQPLPQGVPPGPLPRSAQRSWAHGPTMGGGMFVDLAGPKQFFVRQLNIIPPANAQVAGIAQPTSMATQRPGRLMVRRARIGGRHVTASPYVVPSWPVFGSGLGPGG